MARFELRQVASSLGIAATAQVEFGSVIRKRECVLREEIFESGPGGVALYLGLTQSRLALHYLSEPPYHLRITTPDDRCEQSLRTLEIAAAKVDFCEWTRARV